MVPKMEKNRKGGLYARTRANTMVPNPKKTPNKTEALRGRRSDYITGLYYQRLTRHPKKHLEKLRLYRVDQGLLSRESYVGGQTKIIIIIETVHEEADLLTAFCKVAWSTSRERTESEAFIAADPMPQPVSSPSND